MITQKDLVRVATEIFRAAEQELSTAGSSEVRGAINMTRYMSVQHIWYDVVAPKVRAHWDYRFELFWEEVEKNYKKSLQKQ